MVTMGRVLSADYRDQRPTTMHRSISAVVKHARTSVRYLSSSVGGTLASTHSTFLELVQLHGTGDFVVNEHTGFIEIVINNPTKRNAISGRMMNQFAGIVDHITTLQETDNNLVGLVIRGSGTEAFCAGADLNLAKEVVNTPVIGGLMSAFMTDALNRLRQSNLISVCSLNGPALGGGAELATTTDFRIMPDDEKVFIQFVHAKIGASPGWGGARRLTNIVGRKHAIKLCAGSAQVRADEAHAIGLIDNIEAPYAQYRLQSSADEYFQRMGREFLAPYLKQAYPGSVRAIKASIAATEDLTGSDAKAVEMSMFKQRWCSPDNNAALSAKK